MSNFSSGATLAARVTLPKFGHRSSVAASRRISHADTGMPPFFGVAGLVEPR
jgi:hypothetical protein